MSGRSETRKWIVGLLAGLYVQAKSLGLMDWMERNVILRKEESIDSPGRFQRSRSIPMGRLFELVESTEDAGASWRALFVMKGSQSSFTLHCLGDVTKAIATDPGNVLFVIDTGEQARTLSRKRLQPMVEDCQATAALWQENEKDQNTLELTFPGMTLWLAGSGSAGKLASKSCRRVYGDEVDKWPNLSGEAHGLDLLVQRGKEVEGSLMIAGSTPTIESGAIARNYRRGSQHVYLVPCPHCGELQELIEEGFRWSHCKRGDGKGYDLRRVLTETYYECAGCRGRIDEEHKPDMLERGQWAATNFEEVDGELVPAWEPGVMSAHISDFYSVSPNSTWGQIIVEKLSARGDPKKEQDWDNGRRGLPVKATVIEVRPEGVRRLVCGYKRGTLPEVPVCVTLQCDNQGSEVVKWVLSGWLANGTQMVADWGSVDSRRQALEIMAKRPVTVGERKLYAQRAIMDEGGEDNTTWEVREFCLRHFPAMVPAKGAAGRQVNDLVTFRSYAIAKGGMVKVPVCRFDDDAFKRLLYLQRIARFDPQEVQEHGLARLMLPADVTDAFVRELSGESLKRIPGKGTQWVARPPIDWGDCVKLGEVLWNVIGPEFGGVR